MILLTDSEERAKNNKIILRKNNALSWTEIVAVVNQTLQPHNIEGHSFEAHRSRKDRCPITVLYAQLTVKRTTLIKYTLYEYCVTGTTSS
jgi:hypothetical protein